ncbi:RNA polymerase subunit sigma [Psychromonas sp. psych-6C06]|uniref:sigma-70 family RNA polymerase sigma factor n=1 Tax=Psychromonas sp. psych-6C06 TaxID=2058089 RepID=UPI000C31BE8E|nr:sigma-70 family RNA polymerase sigma factor [Psychromonas sp. psych-6C06]PKF62563.1 RNA polymerase subunit sigma [Psychromonas sp. psych-6C06]
MSLFSRKRNKNSHSSVSIDMNKTIDMNRQQKRYEALVNVYSADLYRYAYWICHDPDIAQDLVQETCLRAWKSLDSLMDDKSAKGWLFTILRRENARRFERKQHPLVDIEDHEIADSADLTQEMDSELLLRKIATLSDEYKEPLLLQLIAGFSAEEIGEQLALNKNTVLTRLFRAKNLLKTSLTSVNTSEASHG